MEKRDIEIKRNIVEKALMAFKDYAKKHLRVMMIAAACLLGLVVLIVAGYVYYEKRQQGEIARFERIIDDYRKAASGDEKERKILLKKTADGLEKVIEGSWWGYVKNNGYYIIGALYFNEGMYSESREYYLKFADKKPRSYFAPLGLQQAARSCEFLKKYDEALKLYNRLEKQYGKSLIADQIYYDLGRIHLNKGDYFKAREYFTRVLNDFPRSPFSQKARERLMIIGYIQTRT